MIILCRPTRIWCRPVEWLVSWLLTCSSFSCAGFVKFDMVVRRRQSSRDHVCKTAATDRLATGWPRTVTSAVDTGQNHYPNLDRRRRLLTLRITCRLALGKYCLSTVQSKGRRAFFLCHRRPSNRYLQQQQQHCSRITDDIEWWPKTVDHARHSRPFILSTVESSAHNALLVVSLPRSHYTEKMDENVWDRTVNMEENKTYKRMWPI